MTGTSTKSHPRISSVKREFVKTLRDHYFKHGRHDLPWRIPEKDSTFDPYKIWVSEIMLQQTQVNRVIEKYQNFLQIFPTLYAVANAPTSAVVTSWLGLGYNRRALFMSQTAKIIQTQYGGKFPVSPGDMRQFPGIGSNTAAAIAVYSYNQPHVFVETNVRTVFIHHFFQNSQQVSDSEIAYVVGGCIDHDNPRQWYWSIMDYGTFLKKSGKNSLSKSSAYKKQSTFVGSKRQLRGKILHCLVRGGLAQSLLLEQLSDERSGSVIEELKREGLISVNNGHVELAS